MTISFCPFVIKSLNGVVMKPKLSKECWFEYIFCNFVITKPILFSIYSTLVYSISDFTEKATSTFKNVRGRTGLCGFSFKRCEVFQILLFHVGPCHAIEHLADLLSRDVLIPY